MRRPPPRSASSAALGPPWRHQARAGRHRQRGELPRPELHREHHVPGLTPSEDPPLHPTAQWQGRALQPHPGRGVPLRAFLLLRAAAPRCRRGVKPPLQRPSTPHHLRQPASCHPRPSTRHQRHDLIHLGEGQPLPRWSLGVLQRWEGVD